MVKKTNQKSGNSNTFGASGDPRNTKSTDNKMTIGDVAKSLNVNYERAREIIVVEERIPYEVAGSGGRSSPKYVVDKSDFAEFERKPRPVGRPRISDKPRKSDDTMTEAEWNKQQQYLVDRHNKIQSI